MGDYIRGVVVKLDLTPEQEVLFKKNYGCTRKIHNELCFAYVMVPFPSRKWIHRTYNWWRFFKSVDS